MRINFHPIKTFRRKRLICGWFFPLDNFPSKEFQYNSFSRKISGNFTGNGSFNYYLSQSQNTFLRSNTTSLDHNKVLFDQTVMRESSHRIDGFICQIIIGGGIIFHKLKVKKKPLEFNQKLLNCTFLCILLSEPWN